MLSESVDVLGSVDHAYPALRALVNRCVGGVKVDHPDQFAALNSLTLRQLMEATTVETASSHVPIL